MRPSAPAVGALICAAAACWVSFGALAFLDARPGARYAGVLPSPLWLGVLLVAVLLAAVVWRPSAHAVAPLWLSAVLLIPWLPLPFLPTAVFVWTGPVTVWLWAAVGAAMAVSWLRPHANIGRWVLELPPRRAAVLAGAVALMIYAAAAWRTSPHHPSGDEPHYLVMTQSLLKDGDLQIENNHAQRDFAAYYNGDLPPDFVRRGQNGAIYSSHAPGLAVLVLPVFAAFGYPGTVVLLVALSAVTAALVWILAWRVTASAPAGWFAWSMMLSAPVLLLTNAVFPDGVAPLLVAVGLLPLVDARARSPKWLVPIGAAVTLLPWLHTRLAVLAGSLAVVIVARLLGEPGRWRRTAAFLALPLVGASAWFGFFWVVYGTPDPTAAIGKQLAAPLLAEGLTGLFFDQKFGLLTSAPIAVCAVAGVVGMLAVGPRRMAVEGLVLVAPYTLMIAAWDMWWGGSSPPARFLVPLVPVLAVAGAVFVSRPHSATIRTAVGALLMLSLLITVTMVWVQRGALIFSDRPDVSPLLSWLSPVVDLPMALPDAFRSPPPAVLLQAAVWLLALAAAGILARAGGRTTSVVVFGLVGQVAVTAAVSAGWMMNHASGTKPFEAGAEVVRQLAEGGRQLGVAYRPFHRVSTSRLASMIPLARLDSDSRLAPSLATGPLPAGTYEVRGSKTGTAGTGTIAVRTDRRSPAIAVWDVDSLPLEWTQQIVVPVQVPGLRIELDDPANSSVRELTLRLASPLSVHSQPFPGVEAGHGARYRSVVLYYMSGRSWLEGGGVWVAGGEGAEFAVRPDAEGALRLLLRNGGVANRIALESGTWKAEIELNAGEERTVEIPDAAPLAATPLRVLPAAGFRPSDVDRSSTDQRFLGVWLEPVS